MPTHARQRAEPPKHMRRKDAPRHLADPLSNKAQAPKKRNVSEVLRLFKGKVSRALAQKRHLRPARLEDANGPASKGKGGGMDTQQQQQQQQQHPRRLDGRHRTAAANGAAAQAVRPLQEEAQRVKAKLLKKKQAAREVNDQVRKACCCSPIDIWKWKQPSNAPNRHSFPLSLLIERVHLMC